MFQHRHGLKPFFQLTPTHLFLYLFPAVCCIFFIIMTFAMTGCASSGVQREAASSVDLGVQNAKNLLYQAADGDIADTYQNTSQTAKGALLGGAAGALTGGVSAIGVAPGAIVGGILGASYGAYIDSTTNRKDRIENRGIQVVKLGDQILVVVPSARIFSEMTAVVKPQAFTTIGMIANYLNRFVMTTVRVAAYTDDGGNPDVDIALSKQQAEVFAKLLNAHGLNARLLYAVGCGSTHLVEKSDGDWDSDNFRIEITLEKMYV